MVYFLRHCIVSKSPLVTKVEKFTRVIAKNSPNLPCKFCGEPQLTKIQHYTPSKVLSLIEIYPYCVLCYIKLLETCKLEDCGTSESRCIRCLKVLPSRDIWSICPFCWDKIDNLSIAARRPSGRSHHKFKSTKPY